MNNKNIRNAEKKILLSFMFPSTGKSDDEPVFLIKFLLEYSLDCIKSSLLVPDELNSFPISKNCLGLGNELHGKKTIRMSVPSRYNSLTKILLFGFRKSGFSPCFNWIVQVRAIENERILYQ